MHGFYSRAELEIIADEIVGARIPGRPRQAPFFESAVANYKVGSRLRPGDGTTWHYCQCGANGLAAWMWDRGMASVVVPQTLAVVGATPVGSKTVVINDGNALHLADYWANGKAELWATPAPVTHQHRIIKSSSASDGTNVTLYLYAPLTNALANGDGLEVCRSVYAEVDQTSLVAAPLRKSIVGVPLMMVTALFYFWTQTWGMCTIAANAGAMGSQNASRQVYFNHGDGTIQTEEEAGWAAGNQPAGYLLPDSNGGAQTIIMLQLDP